MTKEQAKELFRSVDEILSFASSDTKLPIEHTVKRKLISRDEVNRYLREKFDGGYGDIDGHGHDRRVHLSMREYRDRTLML